MLDTIFATKLGMTQAWSKTGKRLVVTRCHVGANMVIAKKQIQAVNQKSSHQKPQNCQLFEIAYGSKKFKNMTKPLQNKLKKSGFSISAKQIKGVKVFVNKDEEVTLNAGDTLNLIDVLEVGDVVKVQGISKGKGFAGVMKRHNFHGGPRTHGQSDRQRAPGSIGCRTDPGRVWKGHRMAGHMGAENKSVTGLKVVYIDETNNEIWISGPIPGFNSSTVRITKSGQKAEVSLDEKASGIVRPEKEEKVEDKKEAKEEVKAAEKPAAKETEKTEAKPTDKSVDAKQDPKEESKNK